MTTRSVCTALALALAACSSDDPLTAIDAPAGSDGGPIVDDAGTAVDQCPATPPACPAPSGLTRGRGLVAIDPCAFPLAPTATAASDYAAVLAAYPPALARTNLGAIAADLNRTATAIPAGDLPGNAPGIRHAYAWEGGDNSVAYWIPQGITGSFDSVASGTVAGRKLVLVSWYYSIEDDPGSTAEKGVRIAILDVTNPAAVGYRFALLVEPVTVAGRPSYRSVPLHAGGLAWIGDRLYVPATSRGFRVFDLAQILRVEGLEDKIGFDTAAMQYNAHGYRYIIPQVDTVETTGACAPRFSFVALDHTSRTLVTGEYDDASVAGRLYRWPLDAAGNLLVTDRGRVNPTEAFFSQESHIQGAASSGDTWWLSSSRPAAGAGELVRTRAGAASTTLGWGDSPEDLAIDPQAMSMWSLTELADERFVYEVRLDAID